MKNTQNKSGFTLVELIIVITILAVLATIAFLSFQGYAAQSRDAKVSSEIGNIRNSVEVKTTEGVSVLSLVASTGSNISGISIGGTGVITTGASTNYKAGELNYALLGTEKAKYQVAYPVGVTTKLGGAYQIAGKLEKTVEAYVVGNYAPRTNTSITVTGTGTNTITIQDPSTGAFKVGDFVATQGEITKVSADLKTLTFASNITGNPTSIALAASETNGLIKETGAGTGAVVNKSTTALPY